MTTTATVLTIGMLTNCPGCKRRKVQPGAEHCPDCTLIEKIQDDSEAAYDLEVLNEFPEDGPQKALKKNAAYQQFTDAADALTAYRRWRSWHEPRNSPRRYCPCCGQEIQDDWL